jgi:hypothetical protein
MHASLYRHKDSNDVRLIDLMINDSKYYNKTISNVSYNDSGPILWMSNIDFTKYKYDGFTLSFYYKPFPNYINEKHLTVSLFFNNTSSGYTKILITFEKNKIIMIGSRYIYYNESSIIDSTDFPTTVYDTTTSNFLYSYTDIDFPLTDVNDYDENNIWLISIIFNKLEYKSYNYTTDINFTDYLQNNNLNNSTDNTNFRIALKKLNNENPTNISNIFTSIDNNTYINGFDNIFNTTNGSISLGNTSWNLNTDNIAVESDLDLDSDGSMTNWLNFKLDGSINQLDYMSSEISTPMIFNKALTYYELEELSKNNIEIVNSS